MRGGLHDAFAKFVKDKGFDGIQDVFDKKSRTYKATNPMIIFAKDKVNTVARTRVKNVDNKILREQGRIAVRNSLPSLSVITAVSAAAIEAGVNANHRKIYEYRSAHPNTKMSDKEILKSLENGE